MAPKTPGDAGARGVVRAIDSQLARLQRREAALAAERQGLLDARAALLGPGAAGPSRGRRISQDEIASYLAEHPGSWPNQIATALDVPATNVSAHLYRAKDRRFVRKGDGWHLASQ